MQHKSNLRLFVVLCVLAIVFVFPAVAHAAPSADVTGTVTAAVGGAKLENIRVAAYYWDKNDQDWNYYFDTMTAADGTYALNGLAPDTYVIRAWDDDKGIYSQKLSEKFVFAGGEQKQANFALDKDMSAPYVDASYWPENYNYYSAIPYEALDWMWTYRGAFLGRVYGRDFIEVVDPYGSRSTWDLRGSGVTTLAVSVNGGPWATVANTETVAPVEIVHTLRVATEGVNAISYYAMDKNGNKSPVSNDLVVIDMTPPVTTYVNDGAAVKFNAFDALVGLGATYYRVGGVGEFVYGDTVAVPASGLKSVEFYSVDKIGNAEAVKMLTVWAPAKLSTPKVSKTSISHTKSFSVTGSVYGRSKAKGSVRVYKLSGGKYKYYMKKSFTEGSNGKFKVSLKLKKGTYKFKSSYGANSATSANMPVMSNYSAKIKVR
ncbi:MAG TPA: carboxypeptidase-like regulatory domain-containing protein [Coriobacteriia bacterium]|nr:carboxypeptidase-like regulatory domain-containing protein [Coriobacteriia bacterium]